MNAPFLAISVDNMRPDHLPLRNPATCSETAGKIGLIDAMNGPSDRAPGLLTMRRGIRRTVLP